ncbi:hypothetical protein SCLCIDRAFT_27094 [Scleroderma citrinum Foug A]|uniref:Uncharacterized protein n=1 Tax=Scleroderma citrinum Foug A TaxID=1036808 RepID=A0A0C3DU30_9AGAM|nr:hypothetical protein SCLCIDRAFT_27094 [Scleroderma citrinum Foug A]
MASPPEGLRCANCKEVGHAAWDRECPIFINLCQRFHANLPDVNYRFYPESDNPSTWEHEPGPDHLQPEAQRPTGARRVPQPHPMFAREDGWKTTERRRNTTGDRHRPTTQPNRSKDNTTQNRLPKEWTKEAPQTPQAPTSPPDASQDSSQSSCDSSPPSN